MSVDQSPAKKGGAPIVLRWSAELREAVRAASMLNNRSLNAEIVTLLQEGLAGRTEQRPPAAGPPSVHSLLMADPVERALSEEIRRLPVEKRLALLTLLRQEARA